MAVTQYIGARYVPLFMGEWESSKNYEPLSIVSYQGNSYTSRQAVPVGVEISNSDYWALTGNYNAQVEQYRQETKEAVTNVNEIAVKVTQQETNAATSAKEAKTSETNAATSAKEAKTSETNAATSAKEAKTSETNAATSAREAEARATASENSAVKAAVSQSDAYQSELNSENAATRAAASALEANTAASTAATNTSEQLTQQMESYVNSASTSATNAATSANNAAANASKVPNLTVIYNNTITIPQKTSNELAISQLSLPVENLSQVQVENLILGKASLMASVFGIQTDQFYMVFSLSGSVYTDSESQESTIAISLNTISGTAYSQTSARVVIFYIDNYS